MADTSIQSQTHSSTPKHKWPAKVAASLVERLFRSRRANRLDPDQTSAHLLRDIGLHHDKRPTPIASLDRLW